MSESETPAKSRLPIWAKLSLFIFFVSMVTIVGGLVVGAAWVAKFPVAARDPVEIGKVVRSFGEIENPLPKGFHYDAAFSVPLLVKQWIIIEHPPDQSVFLLLRVPNPRGQSADAAVEEWSKRNPINNGPLEVKEHGTQPVAGQKMVYVTGSSSGKQEMIGVLPSARAAKEAILVIGINPGNEYKMDTARQLLGAIKAL